MRLPWSLILVVVTGCFAPHAQEGAPCGPGRVCPTGQMCGADDRCSSTPVEGDAGIDAADASQIDAVPDGNAVLDTDNDGINDAADNCRFIMNTNQRDHDADNVGDVCDNCPHIANTTQAATLDGDTVGDACDPDNARTDTQVLFEGFYDPLSNWVVDAGWSVSAGALRATATTPIIAYRDVAVASNLTVVAHANMMAGSTGTPNIGVVARLANTTDFYRCAVVSTRSEVAVHQAGIAGGFTNLNQTGAITPTMTDTNISFDFTGSSMTCKAYGGAVGGDLPATDATVSGNRVGIRMRDGTVAVDYLVIYSH